MNCNREMMVVFGELKSDVTDYSEVWEVMLHITSNVSIIVGGRTFLTEPDFPIVEFGVAASYWLKNRTEKFRFNSMEAEQDPLIEFRRIAPGMFLGFSPFQEPNAPFYFDAVALVNGLKSFAADLDKQLLRNFGVVFSILVAKYKRCSNS